MREERADPAAGELALAAMRARAEVNRRALLSAGAVLVPLPGLDVAVDAGVLVSMMNAVNRAFCLSPEQIEKLGMDERAAVYEALSGVGAVMAGRSVTGVAALTIVRQLGADGARARQRVGCRLSDRELRRRFPTASSSGLGSSTSKNVSLCAAACRRCCRMRKQNKDENIMSETNAMKTVRPRSGHGALFRRAGFHDVPRMGSLEI